MLLLAISACQPLAPGRETLEPGNSTGSTETELPALTRINEIQGAQHRSPMDGQRVENVYGIVTALKGDGFYLQDPLSDDDPRSSEAIFVTLRSYGGVRIGDEVLVKSAKVREWNPAGLGENSLTVTQLLMDSYEVISSGNALPAPVLIGREGRVIPDQIIEDDVKGFVGQGGLFDPEEDGMDFYESLESMRVQVNDALAVSATSTYKEVVVVADDGTGAGLLSSSGTLVLRQDDPNPERIMLDDAFINMPDILVGARFTQPIIGIIDYDFGNFRLQPTHKLKFDQGGAQPLFEVYTRAEAELAIASYNIENFSALDSPENTLAMARDIVEVLDSPDILALQEIQDDDGFVDSALVSAHENLASLADAIARAGGPSYLSVVIDPERNADGGAPGANIRVAYLYRADRGLSLAPGVAGDANTRLTLALVNGRPAFSHNPARVAPDAYAFGDSRKPLAVHFVFQGEDVFVVNCHLNSKDGDGPLYGDVQPPELFSETQRIQQAKQIHHLVADILALDPSANVVILGDMNDFQWSEPLLTLRGKDLSDLVETLPESERFSYIYEGNAQALDHILVSPAMHSKMSFFVIAHINSVQVYDERHSDHDPLLAVFNFDE